MQDSPQQNAQSQQHQHQHPPQQLPPQPQHQPPQQISSFLAQQSKSLQGMNGMRSSSTVPSLNPGNIKVSQNGRKNIEQTTEKNADLFEKECQFPVFAKPFKVPLNHDQINCKLRSTKSENSTTHSDGGRDVESILKMMTSTLEPLTKIAATPRTEIEVHQPNKSYIYANLPPFSRSTSLNGKTFPDYKNS